MSLRTDKNRFFMDIAYRCAMQGTCLRRVYGAVIVDKDGTVISTGYTGSPKNTPHCETCWRQEHNIPSGSNYDKCRSVHAEMNALIQAGKKSRGGNMYIAGIDIKTEQQVDSLPCFLCAKMTVNSGIENIFIMRNGEILRFDPEKVFQMREDEALSN